MQAQSQIFMLLCLIAAVAGCRDNTEPQNGSQPVAPSSLTDSDLLQARRLLQTGIAHLENRHWADSDAALKSLTGLLPENPAVLQNLAVLHVLSIIDPATTLRPGGSPQQQRAFAQAVEQAQSTCSRFRAVARTPDQQSVADLLQGKLLVFAGPPASPSFDQGLQLLRQAVERQPDRPDLNMALALALARRSQADDTPELLQRLMRTFELAPDNLYALQRLLQQQALSMNSADVQTRTLAESSIRNTLQAAVPLVEPLNESVLAFAQVDLSSLLLEALRNDQAQPSSLVRPAMSVANTIKAEIPVRIDQRRIDRHLLEFIRPRFDEALTSRISSAAAGDSAPVVLQRFDLHPQPVAGLSDVTDVQVCDLTLDGLSDLAVVRGGAVEVYTRQAVDSEDWSLVMQSPESPDPWTSILLADIDRDYDAAASEQRQPQVLEDQDQDRRVSETPARRIDTDPDVIAWNRTSLSILRNELNDDGLRSLQPVAQFDLREISDAVAADADADGDLDIFVGTHHGIHLLVNTDGTAFEPRQVSDEPVDRLVAGDLDRNIAIDVAGISLQAGHGLLQNLFHGRFRWMPADNLLGSPSPGSRIATGDFDGNLSWDVVCGGAQGISVQLTGSTGPGVLSPLNGTTVLDRPVADFTVADLDNDGYQDIAALTENGTEILRGTPDGQFTPLEIATPQQQGTSLKAVDFDEDGDLDLLMITDSGALQLLTNVGGSNNHWMKIVVRGANDDDQFRSRRVNMHGIGTVLEVLSGDVWQTQIVSQPVVHIGLGQAARVDAIRLVWPNGVPQNIVTENLLQTHVCILAPQILKGSCPYIYTWNGEQFQFFSDCLWASPIGLVQASGDLAPTREWENLLIPGEQLVERDGEYILQFTEELWEIAYFDHVELLAIDHSSDVQVFTNEKVGPPDLAEHRVHTVAQPIAPLSVVDGHGNDLLPSLSQQDGKYAHAFTERRLQGLTDEWTMEIELPPPDSADNIRLFLTGWIFPTDTSLNLQISQNPDLTPPEPPSIEVLQPNGHWETAVPFFGFPGGKTKTIVVDLSNAVGPERTRFRLRSSMELYFDHVFLTAGETPQPTRVQQCELLEADLHERGFSRRNYRGSVFRDGYGPEGYDYFRLTKDPRWPTISGFFTRYGPVEELLQHADDRLAVMGPGDELTLRFSVPGSEGPRTWTRDFVLKNVGWDKDADLNTVYGQSTEPYPCRAMTRYPFAETDQLPDSAAYRDYLQRYQTRTYAPRRFRGLLRDQLPGDSEPPAQTP